MLTVEVAQRQDRVFEAEHCVYYLRLCAPREIISRSGLRLDELSCPDELGGSVLVYPISPAEFGIKLPSLTFQ